MVRLKVRSENGASQQASRSNSIARHRRVFRETPLSQDKGVSEGREILGALLRLESILSEVPLEEHLAFFESHSEQLELLRTKMHSLARILKQNRLLCDPRNTVDSNRGKSVFHESSVKVYDALLRCAESLSSASIKRDWAPRASGEPSPGALGSLLLRQELLHIL